MYQKTIEKEGYSKKQLDKIKAVLRKIDMARKDPAILRSARQIIKESI